jgi:hypothetical protein
MKKKATVHQFGLREISGDSLASYEAAGENALCTKGLRIKNTRLTNVLPHKAVRVKVYSDANAVHDKARQRNVKHKRHQHRHL